MSEFDEQWQASREKIEAMFPRDAMQEYWLAQGSLEPSEATMAMLYHIKSTFTMEITRALAYARMIQRGEEE